MKKILLSLALAAVCALTLSSCYAYQAGEFPASGGIREREYSDEIHMSDAGNPDILDSNRKARTGSAAR